MLINNNNFILTEIPKLNPLSQGYKNWWKEQMYYCVNGYWSGGKWMPGNLYFYINFWHILLNKTANSKNKSLGIPTLRDVEWEVIYYWMEARGFSRFENQDPKDIWETDERGDFLFNPDSKNFDGRIYKEGVTPRELIRRIYKQSQGRPLFENQAKNLLWLSSRGIGKDLHEDSLLYKENKEIKIKDVKIGDRIYDDSGKLTTVINRVDYNDQEQFEVTLSDGRCVQCGGGHLWEVIDNRERIKVLSLNDIKKDYLFNSRKNGKQDSRYFIKQNEPIEYTEKEFYISPYILGFLIGDGGLTQSKASFTTNDIECLDYIEKDLPEEYKINRVKSTKYGYSIVKKSKKGNSSNLVVDELKRLNLMKHTLNKSIPTDYLYSSVHQRLELLRGLMDTDGYCNRFGSLEFTTISEQLSKDFLKLVRSLGIVAKISTKIGSYKKNNIKIDCNKVYRILLKTGLSIFKIKRKLERLNVNASKYAKANRSKLAIIKIESKGIKPSVCIAVDNKSKLFLTNDHIVTHNSYLVAGGILGHEFTFQKNTQMLVGAGDAKYSSDLLRKVKIGLEFFVGGQTYNGEYYPSPLHQETHGSWESSKTIESFKDFKVGGTWVKKGRFNSIKHVSYKDKPEAGVGTRPAISVKEEIGFFDNLLASYGPNKEAMMNGSLKFGSEFYLGCVCAGTKVWTNDGRLINIEDLKKEDGILGFDGHKVVQQEVEWIKPPDKKLCYRFTTFGGNEISCSYDHPILTSSRKNRYNNTPIMEFKKAEDIKEGEYIYMADKVEIFGNTNVEHARMIGLLIGDGYYGQSVSLSIDDTNTREYVTSNFETKIRKEFITKEGLLYSDYTIKKFRDKLKEAGINNQVKNNKRLPINIHTYNKKSLSELIAGLFDADGNVCYNTKKKTTRVVLTSVVSELLKEVKFQLSKFGISGNIIKEKRNQEPSEEYKGQQDYIYRLYVSKDEDVKRFKENIPIIHSKKVATLNNFKKGNRDFGRPNESLFVFNPSLPKGKSFIGKNIKGVRFEGISKIEDIGEQNIYNLTAGTNHNYLADNVIVANTGGDMDGGTVDAEKMFYDPENFDLLTFEDTWEGKGKIAYFIPATFGLNQFKDEQGNTKEKEALDYLIRTREKLREGKNRRTLDDELQFRPIVPSEIFLRKTGNMFPTAELKLQLAYVENDDKARSLGDKGLMARNAEGKPIFQPNPDLKECDYPVKSDDKGFGCVKIWEYPMRDTIPFGLYIGGIDPYDHDESTTNSLGSTFIYKRFYKADKTYNWIVAEYTGRPESSEEYYEQCRLLLEYYNATAMYENQVKGLFKYFKQKFCTHLLADQPDIIRDIIKDSKVERGKGIHMVQNIKNYAEILVRDWLKEEYAPGKLNLNKIYSIPLLKELIKYHKDGNFDRVIALMMVRLYDTELYNIHTKHTEEVINLNTDNFFTRSLF